jgi:hypothetical protein
MKRSRIITLICLPVLLIIFIIACKKNTVIIEVPPAQATFLNKTGGNYFITGPTVADTIQVGVTNVSNADRKISFTISSPNNIVFQVLQLLSPQEKRQVVLS